MSNLPSIQFGNGRIELQIDGTWKPSGEEVAALARIATTLSRPPLYEYAPSHGSYGFLLASMIAAKIGGEVKYPPATNQSKEPPDGVVF